MYKYGIDFTLKTHSILELANKCSHLLGENIIVDLRNNWDDNIYVKTRYPNTIYNTSLPFTNYTDKDAERYKIIAEKIIDKIVSL